MNRRPNWSDEEARSSLLYGLEELFDGQEAFEELVSLREPEKLLDKLQGLDPAALRRALLARVLDEQRHRAAGAAAS